MNTTSWKNDEKAFKMSEGTSLLGINMALAMQKRLSSLANKDGWNVSKGDFEDEGGLSFFLTPKTLDKSSVDANSLIADIKSEFKGLSEERLSIETSSFVRWAFSMVRVTFH